MSRLRAVIFGLVLAYISIGPLYKQVLHGRSDAFRAWQMFHLRGLGVCDARFYARFPDGRVEPIDRYKVLGYKGCMDAPLDIRRFRGEADIRRVGYLLRNRIGEGIEVCVTARVATRNGWEELLTDVCFE